MINKPCAIALEWWLRQQNKFEGANVQTVESQLTVWEVDGVERPTDEQVNQIVEDYIGYSQPS